MTKILYFEVVAFIIQGILLISIISRKMLAGRSNRLFAELLILQMLTTIFDLGAELFGVWIPLSKSNMWIRWMMYYGYFIFRNMTTPLYQLFICSVTDTWHILKKSKWMQAVLIFPYALICVVLLLNPFNHQVFYFEKNFVYNRGPLIFVLYVVSFFYLLFGVIYLIRYKKIVTNDKFVVLMLMYPLNVLAILIQLFLPCYLVEVFMTSLTLLLIALVIQRPEEIINPVLGVRSYIAYMTDIKKAYSIRKPVQIIFAKLTNYEALSLILEYDTRTLLLKGIASELTASYKDENLLSDDDTKTAGTDSSGTEVLCQYDQMPTGY